MAMDPLSILALIAGDDSFKDLSSPLTFSKAQRLTSELFDNYTVQELTEELQQEVNHQSYLALKRSQAPYYREDIDFLYTALLVWSIANTEYTLGPIAQSESPREEIIDAILSLHQLSNLPSSNAASEFQEKIKHCIKKAFAIGGSLDNESSFIVATTDNQRTLSFDWYNLPINRLRRELDILLSSDIEGKRFIDLIERRRMVMGTILISVNDQVESDPHTKLAKNLATLIWKLYDEKTNRALSQEAFTNMQQHYRNFYQTHNVAALFNTRSILFANKQQYLESPSYCFSDRQIKQLLRRGGVVFQSHDAIQETRTVITNDLIPVVLKNIMSLHKCTRHVHVNDKTSLSAGCKVSNRQFSVITCDTVIKALSMNGLNKTVYGFGTRCGTSTRYLFTKQIQTILQQIDADALFADEVALSVIHDLVIDTFYTLLMKASEMVNDPNLSMFSHCDAEVNPPRYERREVSMTVGEKSVSFTLWEEITSQSVLQSLENQPNQAVIPLEESVQYSVIDRKAIEQVCGLCLQEDTELCRFAQTEGMKAVIKGFDKFPIGGFFGFGTPVSQSTIPPRTDLGNSSGLSINPELYAYLIHEGNIPLLKHTILTAQGLVYLSAIVEYLVCEILESAINIGKDRNGTNMITSRDIYIGISFDQDLHRLYSGILFRDVGAIPFIHKRLRNIPDSVKNSITLNDLNEFYMKYCKPKGEEVHVINPFTGDFIGMNAKAIEDDAMDRDEKDCIQPIALVNALFNHLFPMKHDAANSSDEHAQRPVGIGLKSYRQLQAITQNATVEDELLNICQDPACTWIRHVDEVKHEQMQVEPVLDMEIIEDLLLYHLQSDKFHFNLDIEFSYESLDVLRCFIEGMMYKIGQNAIEYAIHANRLYVTAADIRLAYDKVM